MTRQALRQRPGEYRWSSAAKCPRMAVYAQRGAEARPRTEEEERILARGRLFGEYMARRFEARYGPENVTAEKEVAWGDPGDGTKLGVLHTDVYVAPERAAFEVKSSTSPSSVVAAAVIQNAGQQYFDPEVDKGGVILVEPASLDEITQPVKINDEIEGKIHHIAQEIAQAEADPDFLPCRVCKKPSDAIGMFCPFADQCFADPPTYEPPDPIQLDADRARLAGELVVVERQLASGKGYIEGAKERRGVLIAELREVTEPGVEYVAAGVRLKRTVFSKTSYAGIGTGIEAGDLDAEQLDPYKRTSEQERWTVVETEAVPKDKPLPSGGGDDYGSEAPF